MKIKFRDRMILFLGGLLTIAAGFFVAVAGLQFQGSIGESFPLWARIVCVACGVLTAAFGVYVIAFPYRRLSRRQDFVTQKTDNGELRISVKAVENLVQKCIDLHEEIRLVSMDVRSARSGVTVELVIALANNISIPLAVASLQKQIKQYLAASSGIEVKEVRVSVEAMEDELEPRPASGGEDAVQEDGEKAPAAKKLPLHRRLFGKADQPAILPEPPRAEDVSLAEGPKEGIAPATEEIIAPSAPLPEGTGAGTADNTPSNEEMEETTHE